MQYQCDRCSRPFDAKDAAHLRYHCIEKCGGSLVLPQKALSDIDARRLPYPVALTFIRLQHALTQSNPVVSLFAFKDCFEASVKFLGSALLTEYLASSTCTPERNEVLLDKLVRPSLGHWVNEVCRSVSGWLGSGRVAPMFVRETRGKPEQTELLKRCSAFVTYRNDTLGHGATRSDDRYRRDLEERLPMLSDLLRGIAGLADSPLLLVVAEDRAEVWMGPVPSAATIPGVFRHAHIGQFVLGDLSLFPFITYLPDHAQQNRLHFYDSLHRYKGTKQDTANVLEYDGGERHPRTEPVAGLEQAFNTDLLAKAFKLQRGKMAIIEGRVANFGEIIESHAAIVGRKFAIERVRAFLRDNDRGLLVIEGEPGKGKTVLLAHLIEEEFGRHAPRPVHFFYRRTAGITDPDVCVKSLYHSLLDAHDITEAEESRALQAPEEVYNKLVNLLAKEIAPRLTHGRPQLIFIDALDESNRDAFRRIPENLPEGVYVIATTRPVTQRATLARRGHVHWFNLDDPDLVSHNLGDGLEYVHRELVHTDIPVATQDELARVGGGNFLVLKLLCQRVKVLVRPDEVRPLLERLATGAGHEQLGVIYE